MIRIEEYVAKTVGIDVAAVLATLRLLDGGATIPFISRYRKEATGGLDEVKIAEIAQSATVFDELSKRKETILNSIEEQGKLTPELKQRIENCYDKTELEDIYLPYKPKRKTRADMAREKGLEPLAKILMSQQYGDVEDKAYRFVKGDVKSTDDALQGARDIIAEWVNEDEWVRNSVRKVFQYDAILTSKVVKGKETEGDKYRDYFDWSGPLSRCSSHRLLAIRRGEKEGYLKCSISPADDDKVYEKLNRRFVKNESESSEQVEMAVRDSYKRLLKPSIESEFAAISKEKADTEAIRVFAQNLKQLLMAPPLGQKRVLAIDPGFRTGCKVVCLDAQGNLLHNETIYPHPPKSERHIAERKLQKLVEQYKIEAISIGNGTAGRETEALVTNIRYDRKIQVFMVSEDGASIYSASKIARDEFPDYDVTVRGSVSIGRRLMDPLAELVKIDPKSIGVGQYQYDVNQTELKESLDRTVENCVNQVGVNLNTASKYLLTYVSGLSSALAQNIVDYRAENGAFENRKELMKVPRMGAKSFEQSAGFLRIPNARNPLDNSAVHPESYHIVERMAKDTGCTVQELITNREKRESIKLENYITDGVGMPTLLDIMAELEKPGRDPRSQIEVFSFDDSIRTINDLKVGMVLPGIVTNITDFGCFVDIGIKENGLIHISEMSGSYVSDPSSVVSIHQQLKVRVKAVDIERKRIALSLKE
ncbi:MAG: RNA-binding transcriptional accessory protein [Bacteroidaceae bacterium]|nr:RNA-binding transcriptional accessory protein [Bacteroidaceae bacterium]